MATGALVMAIMNTFRVIGPNPAVAGTIYPAIGRPAGMDMYGLKVVGPAKLPEIR
jgi:hypothetical protein